MSELVEYDFNIDAAVDYNQRQAVRLGWYGRIPERALQDYPDLGKDPVNGKKAEREAFAFEVRRFQIHVFQHESEHDGKLGGDTWNRILNRYDFIDANESYILWKNRRFVSKSAKVISFEEHGGFDLHKAGKFNSRKGKNITLIVVHWGGTTPRNLYKYFSSTDRSVSTHFGCGPEGAYQMLDLKWSAWHAGYPNRFSVGIDICQQPTRKWLEFYMNNGYNVQPAKNETNRGRSEIISLDPLTARVTRDLVLALCGILGVPVRAPRGEKGLGNSGPIFHGVLPVDKVKDGTFSGVVGHHHLKDGKWDIAPWWSSVFNGTALG